MYCQEETLPWDQDLRMNTRSNKGTRRNDSFIPCNCLTICQTTGLLGESQKPLAVSRCVDTGQWTQRPDCLNWVARTAGAIQVVGQPPDGNIAAGEGSQR
jgi:hypothetical protein